MIPKALEDGHWCLVSINFCQDTPILGKFSKSGSSNYIVQCAHVIILSCSCKRLSVLVNILLIKCNNNYFN
jgi:hypothetical protein